MFSVKSAVAYNTDKPYSQKAIDLIQLFLNVPRTATWDAATVTAVHAFQKKIPGLDPDGKVGKLTLGAFIGEYAASYRTYEADVLRQYPYEMLSAPGTVPLVLKFTHHTTKPFRFERYHHLGKDYWQAACRFTVHIELDPARPAAELSRYEYRQYIRGYAWARRAGKGWEDVKTAFQVPPYKDHQLLGLHPDYWKEDGQVEKGVTEMYGYRKTATCDKPGERDLWLAYPNGPTYLMKDTPSMAEVYVPGHPVEVDVHLDFRGEVVEVTGPAEPGKSTEVRKVQTKTWGYHFEQAMDWDEAEWL